MKKRICRTAFCTVILLLLISFTTPALSAAVGTAAYAGEGSGTLSPYGSAAALETTSVYRKIRDDMYNLNTSSNIASYKIPVAQLAAVLTRVRSDYPELFYLTGKYKYNYNPYTNIVTVITLTFNATNEEILARRAVYEQKLDEIVSDADASWSELEKVVFIHDYLAMNFEYDTDYSNYDTYSFLTQGKGVCQAYMLTFTALCSRLGIEASWAQSTEKNHIWNTVKLGGNWYQLDATWDDPLADKLGRVSRKYFLVSDAKMDSYADHGSDIEQVYACTDTSFDNYFWRDINRPFVFASGLWYTIDTQSSSLSTVNFTSQTLNSVYEIDDKWFVFGSQNSYYTLNYSYLGEYRDCIIFSTSRSFYIYNPVCATVSLLAAADISTGYVYGLTVRGTTILYETEIRHFSGNATKRTYNLTGTVIVTYGDASGDRIINSSDILMIRMYMQRFGSPGMIEVNADVNGDGSVNMLDLLRLRLFLGGGGVKLGPAA